MRVCAARTETLNRSLHHCPFFCCLLLLFVLFGADVAAAVVVVECRQRVKCEFFLVIRIAAAEFDSFCPGDAVVPFFLDFVFSADRNFCRTVGKAVASD